MRPHRNPGLDRDRIAINQAYIDHQMALPEGLREEDNVFSANANLMVWDGWRPEQPNDWWGGLDALPVQWGGLSEAFSAQDLAAHDPRGNAAPPRFARAELRLDRELMPDNMTYWKKHKPLNLDKLPPGDAIIRDISLPPFKIDYDSHEQINTKLNGTVIMIKDNPFFIARTCALPEGKFGLIVQDSRSNVMSVLYDDVKDCRPIAPGYVTYRGTVYWLFRTPERQNQQGMNHRNTFYKSIQTGDLTSGARHEFLLEALANRKDCQYAPNLDQLIEQGNIAGLRLSNNIALYKAGKKGAAVGVEYCGRPLGLMVNGTVKVLDETDLRPSWIHKDLHRVGLVMGE
jgi:hypothetical protein